MTLGGQSLSVACTLPMLDPTERQKIPISLTFKVTEGTDETELKIWFRVFHPRKLNQWCDKHCFLMVCYASPVHGLPAVNTKTQVHVENLSRNAPWLGQGCPHSSVSVCKVFCAPLQSLQKANLARAERQSKTRHLSSVPGTAPDFLCNCWICLCLSFHLYNWSFCQFSLFKGSRWLYGETLVELELWAICLIYIYENSFGAKRHLTTWQHYFYHLGATYCTFSNFWNTKYIR